MASDDPILAPLGAVIGKAKDALIEARPQAAPHVEAGNYATVIAGWRAQFAVARAYQAKEVLAARLPTSESDALTELASGEYDTPRNEGSTKARGEVVLTRTVVHSVAGEAISTADATDGTTVVALLTAIAAAANAHLGSVYSSTTGNGAHEVADGSGTLVVFTDNMGQFCTSANNVKLQVNRHFANTPVVGGDAIVFHKDVDAANAVVATDAATVTPSSSFSASATAEQTALLTLVNATKAAYNAHAALGAMAGTVRAGTLFRVDSAPNAVPPVTGGEYIVLVDTYAAVGTQTIYPPIEATVDGPAQNLPIWSVGGPTLAIKATSPLFDNGATLAFSVASLLAAGGSTGQTDPELRRAATAGWTGVYGPTTGALVAGALRSRGVSHLRDIENTTRGGSVVYPADASWAWSSAWSQGVDRELRAGWLGTGCRLSMGRVVNRIVRVEATIALRDANLQTDPSAITAEVLAACRTYWDDRPDWNIWRLGTLRAVLSRASRSIMRCSEVRVLDQDGRPIAEPDAVTPPADMTHWYFADNALLLTYTGPS